jgi:hypothetical protein
MTSVQKPQFTEQHDDSQLTFASVLEDAFEDANIKFALLLNQYQQVVCVFSMLT